MMPTIRYTEVLTTVTCICGINYAIPDNLDRQLLGNHQTTWCPLGHGWHYTDKTNVETLTEELDRERHRTAQLTAQLDQTKAAHGATKGQLTKARNRAAKGVCPCCKRSFVDMVRHVQSKHPGFQAEAGGWYQPGGGRNGTEAR